MHKTLNSIHEHSPGPKRYQVSIAFIGIGNCVKNPSRKKHDLLSSSGCASKIVTVVPGN